MFLANSVVSVVGTLFLMNFPLLIQSKTHELSTHLSMSGCTHLTWSDSNCLFGPVVKNVDVAESVFQQLCLKSWGKFPSPNSCDLYLVCNKNSFTLNRCAPSHNFNSASEKCVSQESFPCELADQNNSAKRAIYDSNDLNNLDILEGKEGRQIRKVDECDVDFIEQHPEYCNKFQVCSNGVKITQLCGPGTNFDALNKACDFVANVDCQSRRTDFGTYGCFKGLNYITSHPENCAKFIECEKGKLYVKNCGPGTLFNVEISGCDHPSKVECKKPISLEHDIDVNHLHSRHPPILRNPRSHRPSDNDNFDLYCSTEQNYIAPHPKYCNRFVECENGQLFFKSCGPGTVYNPKIAQCDWPRNTRRPILTFCDQFEECIFGQYKLKSCHRGTTFDPETMSCGHHKCNTPTSTPPPTTTEKTTTTTTTTTTENHDYDHLDVVQN